MGQSPWTSPKPTTARWVTAFLILAVAFAAWAIARGIVTTRTSRAQHVELEPVRAEVPVAQAISEQAMPPPRARGLRPAPATQTHRHVQEAPPPSPLPLFEPAEPQPSNGPAINDRRDPVPEDPTDEHHEAEAPFDRFHTEEDHGPEDE